MTARPRPRHVALYARKSTAQEVAVSVPTQLKVGRRYAAEHYPDLPVVEYVDPSISAADPDKFRPGFADLDANVEAGAAVVVVTREQSRLMRNLEGWAALCRRWSRAGLAEVDTTTTGRIAIAEGRRLAGNITAVVDADYVEQVRLKTQGTIDENAVEGRPHGRAGYGFRSVVGDDGRPAWEEDPEEGDAVRLMVERIAAGDSLGLVARTLDDAGVPTPRGGTRWRRQAVAKIVTAPRLIGKRVHRGRLYPAAWPPIVDRGVWERAQARLSTQPHAVASTSRRRYLLSGGLAVCASCGANLISGHTTRAGAHAPAYQCPHPSRGYGSCGKCTVGAEDLERFVVERVGEWLNDPLTAERYNAGRPAVDGAPLDALAAVEAQLADLAERWGAGDLLDVEYQAARRVLVERHEAATAAVAATAADEERLDLDEVLAVWADLDVEERRAVLVDLVARVEVRGGRAAVTERAEVVFADVA